MDWKGEKKIGLIIKMIIATNQAANFTAYQEFKKMAQEYQNLSELPSYQHLILGGVSGAMGKFFIFYFAEKKGGVSHTL
jgi:uncharacterized membrane protein